MYYDSRRARVTGAIFFYLPISIFIQIMSRRIVKSWSNRRLLHEARAFLEGLSEAVAILPTRSPGQGMAQIADQLCGVHQLTLTQLAAELSRPIMATRGLVPLSSLGMEAVAARAVHLAGEARELTYFLPVADLPGFAKALSRTLRELRLARITPDQVAETGQPGADLWKLLARFEEELESRKLADLALMLELAVKGVEGHRLSGLPLLLLDPPLESMLHRELLRALAQRALSILAAITAGEREWEADLGVKAKSLDPDTAASPLPIERLRRYLFADSIESIPEGTAGFEILSAPGEGLEAVEIARRILRLAGEGVAFDEMAILLRNPDRQQVLIEEALRRARIPAYMSRGSARPDPSGRALLALLACAAEKCAASRFAEYLSLGQVPRADEAAAPPKWVGPVDEALADPDSDQAEAKAG